MDCFSGRRWTCLVATIACLLVWSAASSTANLRTWYQECCRNHTTNQTCVDGCIQVVNAFEAQQFGTASTLINTLRGCGLSVIPHSPLVQCIQTGKQLLQASSPTNSLASTTPQAIAATAAGVGRFSRRVEDCKQGSCPKPEAAPYMWCCHLATNSTCRSECETQLQTGRSTVGYANCLKSEQERKMAVCIEQVDFAAWPSCDGLRFCKNFNRPSVHFNNCSLSADIGALTMYTAWLKSGSMDIGPWGVRFDINISACRSLEKWKALSCLITIAPSNSKLDRRMCRSSCNELLNICAKRDRFISSQTCNTSANAHFFSNEPDCIQLDQFLVDPEVPSSESYDAVTNPCSPNPCIRQKCVVNHDCLKSGSCVRNFTCLPGCPIDMSGSFMLDSDWIKLPSGPAAADGTASSSPSAPPPSSGIVQVKYCQCNGTSGKFSQCVTITHAGGKPCGSVADGQQYAGTGRLCLCDNGLKKCTLNLTLSKHYEYVRYVLQPPVPDRYTGCPNCSRDANTGCGADGKTYLNQCFAQCNAGCAKGQPAPCSNDASCQDRRSSVCNCNTSTHRCVPQPGVCLSATQACPQFQCVPAACTGVTTTPFCDTCGVQHSQICSLTHCLRASSHAPLSCHGLCQWSYAGRCRLSCSQHQVVCGSDSQTYHSECALQAMAVPLDYIGPCQHITQDRTKTHYNVNCTGIRCPTLPPFCTPLPQLPGTCCRLCGSALSIVVSDTSSDIHSNATGQPAIRVTEVIQHLQLLRDLSFCEVRGFLLGQSLLVTVQTDYLHHANISASQVIACQAEARLLHSLITLKQPAITAFAPLSILAVASLHTSPVTMSTTAPTVAAPIGSSGAVSRQRLPQPLTMLFCCLATLILTTGADGIRSL